MKLARALLLATLEDLITQRAPAAGAWLGEIPTEDGEPEAFVQAVAGAPRAVGRSALALDREEAARLRGLGVTWSLARWAIDDLARAAVLMRAGSVLPPGGFEAVVDRAYHAGDQRQQQAVLRALPLLPYPDRFIGLGTEAVRSGHTAIFEAIACENPFPAAHFPSMNFNHMVLAALVTGVALDRVVGLGARVTPELVRMANDYAAERRAAGRSVPADLDYITESARVVAA